MITGTVSRSLSLAGKASLDEFGVSILIVEQIVRAGLSVAERVIVMKTGQKIYDGSPNPLHDHVELMKYF